MKSHLQSYPCPLQINSFWNLGFLLGITIILQIITGIFLGLHYTSDLNSAYSSLFFFIREIYYGWCLRYLHSSGASFVFLFLFLHLGRAISYGSYFYFINTWFSGILLFFFLMGTAFISFFSLPGLMCILFSYFFPLLSSVLICGLLECGCYLSCLLLIFHEAGTPACRRPCNHHFLSFLQHGRPGVPSVSFL